MKHPHFILIADRNPNICRYLTRELQGEGYRLFAVGSFAQLCHWVANQHPVDLLVLDPALLEEDKLERYPDLWAHIRSRPLILHCLPGDRPAVIGQHPRVLIVEKSGNSITALKKGLQQLLEREGPLPCLHNRAQGHQRRWPHER